MTAKDILTTADTAKLLGVSVRTAQLLIEEGTVPSWKTPGGHRRVYRRDVESIITGAPREAEGAAAWVVGVASGATRAALEALFAAVGECQAEFHDDVHGALMAIGAIRPRVVIVDLEAAAPERADVVATLAQDPSVGGRALVLIGGDAAAPRGAARVRTAAEAVAAVRERLADPKNAQPRAEDLPYPVALNEAQRLVALERSGLVDSAPEEALDRIVWLAAHTLNAPIGLVTLLTPTRQVFKARLGLDMTDTPRSMAFCNQTVVQKDVFTVEDLSRDPRFADNPAVAGPLGFRFYAGAPIFDAAGFALGSLCVIDVKPRRLDPTQARTLTELAALATHELRLRDAEGRLRRLTRAQARPSRSTASSMAK